MKEPSGRRAMALPSGYELSKRLRKVANFPKRERAELATIAQYYEVAIGRRQLDAELRDVFGREYLPSRLHRYLGRLPRPLLIVTTNYDDLIEQALVDAGRPFDLVVHAVGDYGELVLWRPDGETEPKPVDPVTLDIDLSERTVIYKMHGAVDRLAAKRDQYVITEDDYVDFVSRVTTGTAAPAIFAQPFQERQFLFLGYGLRDWTLRVVLSRVERDLRRRHEVLSLEEEKSPLRGDQRSWAVDANPSALEARFWDRRGVDVYRLTIDEFLDGLEAA